MGAAWKLDWVKIALDGESYHFNANRWLDKSKGDKQIRIDINPESSGKT